MSDQEQPQNTVFVVMNISHKLNTNPPTDIVWPEGCLGALFVFNSSEDAEKVFQDQSVVLQEFAIATPAQESLLHGKISPYLRLTNPNDN